MVYQKNRMHYYNMVKYYVNSVMQLLLDLKESISLTYIAFTT